MLHLWSRRHLNINSIISGLVIVLLLILHFDHCMSFRKKQASQIIAIIIEYSPIYAGAIRLSWQRLYKAAHFGLESNTSYYFPCKIYIYCAIKCANDWSLVLTCVTRICAGIFCIGCLPSEHRPTALALCGPTWTTVESSHDCKPASSYFWVFKQFIIEKSTICRHLWKTPDNIIFPEDVYKN